MELDRHPREVAKEPRRNWRVQLLTTAKESRDISSGGCKNCRGYFEELDRRDRWNGRSVLIEDWGSPHVDLVAMQSHCRRPVPSLIQLARSTRGGR